METKAKSRWVAIALALSGVFLPGLHKFYLRQPGWGAMYLLMMITPIPRFASFAEALWYLFQGQETFDRNFNHGAALPAQGPASSPPVNVAQIGAVADALRQIDQLRQDGLISEYEFEQKRRQLLDRIG